MVTDRAVLERLEGAAKYTPIRIKLTKAAVAALRRQAQDAFRDPQQHAAYILERALLGAPQDVCVGPVEDDATG